MQTENLRLPALFVQVLAWAVFALSLITGLGLTLWLASYSLMGETAGVLVAVGIASVLAQVLYLPSIISVLVWVYLAHSNLRRAGIQGLNYSPAWATFSFFVPIANLWVPFAAMRELANRSAGLPEELSEASVNEVQSWWGCFLGSAFLSVIILYNLLIAMVPGVWVTTPFWATQGIMILGSVLSAGSAYFLIQVVRLVTRSQRDGIGLVSAFE